MANIRNTLTKKSRQNPQFDFLWRVELPDLTIPPGAMLASGNYGFGAFGNDGSLADPRLQEGQFVSVRDERKSRSSKSFLSGVGSAVSGALTTLANAFGASLSDIDEMNHRVYSFTGPFKSFDTKKVTTGPSFTYHAAQSDIGAISMTVDEMEDGLTLDYFDRWMALIEPSPWFHNPPGIYKRDIRHVKLSSTKLDIHYTVYKGYFPTEISPVETSYDGTGVLQYNVTLTGDSAEHIVIPEALLSTMVTMEELSILKQQFLSGRLNVSSAGGVRAAGILNNVLRNFG